MVGVVGVLAAPASSAATSGTGQCNGASCTGLDPTGRCDGDAYTVRSIAIIAEGQYAGQLDLRYSPSCRSNWGRFTAPTGIRDILAGSMGPVPLSGRVTAWNPGGPSQQPVQGDVRSFSLKGYSTWSGMVDGRGLACTGVEPFFHDPSSQSGDVESRGWFWGPCA